MDLTQLSAIEWLTITHNLSNYLELFIHTTESIEDRSYFSIGLNFEQIKIEFPHFMKYGTIDTKQILSENGLKEIVGALSTSNADDVMNVVASNETVLESLIEFYGFEITIAELRDSNDSPFEKMLRALNERYDIELNHPPNDRVPIRGGQVPFLKNGDIDPNYFNILLEPFDQENIVKRKRIKPTLPYLVKRSNIFTYSINAFINSLYLVGGLIRKDVDDLETALYFYGLGFAEMSDEFVITLKKTVNDFQNPTPLPKICNKSDLLEKEHGMALWHLVCISRAVLGKPKAQLIDWNYYLYQSRIRAYGLQPGNYSITSNNLKFRFVPITGSDVLYDQAILFTYVGRVMDSRILRFAERMSIRDLKLLTNGIILKQSTAIINTTDYDGAYIDHLELCPTWEVNGKLSVKESYEASVILLYMMSQRVQ